MAAQGDDPVTTTEAVELDAGRRTPGRRRALWGALVAIAVGAGALVVGTRGDDGSPRPLPVALGAGGAGAARSEAATMSADMAMMAWVTYVAGDDLPPLGDDAAAYVLDGSVEADDVRALARALGFDGQPKQRDEYAWFLSTDEGTLEVYQPGGTWWFSNQPQDAGGKGVSSGGGSSGFAGCPPDLPPEELERCVATMPAIAPVPATTIPPRPEDLPSADEARTIALELIEATGTDVSDAKVTVDGPYDTWSVMIEPRVDGVLASGLMANVAVGIDGVVQYASGSLAEPERLGDYPVVDTRGAIDRLNEQVGGVGLAARTDVAADAVTRASEGEMPVASGAPTTTTVPLPEDCRRLDGGFEVVEVCQPAAPAGSGTVDEVCSAPSAPLASQEDGGFAEPVTTTAIAPAVAADIDCPSPDPYVEPEPLEVVLHEAEPILVLLPAFDDSGDSYLVPGYRMTGDDEHVVDAVAVDDGSLLPPLVEPEPMPIDEPGASEPGCATPPPGPDGAVPEICLVPDGAEPGSVGGATGSVEPSGPVRDPDAPVSSP